MFVFRILSAALLAACVTMSSAQAQLVPKRIVPVAGGGTIIFNLTHPRGTNKSDNIYEVCLIWRLSERGKLVYVRIYKDRKGRIQTEEREISVPGRCHDILVKDGDKIKAVSSDGPIQISYRLIK